MSEGRDLLRKRIDEERQHDADEGQAGKTRIGGGGSWHGINDARLDMKEAANLGGPAGP
jgi:hypothetical protein